MIHGVPDVECLLFQNHSQQNADNAKKIHKIDKFPKECHQIAFIMLLPGTVSTSEL